MILSETEKNYPIKFDCLEHPQIAHGCFSRHGGISSRPYDSLNVGFHVDDHSSHVAENRNRIKSTLAIGLLVSAKQVHGDRVLSLTQLPDSDREYDGYDAFVTNLPGIGLMVQQADCQAVMLFDHKKKVVANIHSGWRGSVQNIIATTVQLMVDDYNSAPADILAVISPSLGPCCAEFKNYLDELPTSFHSYQLRPDYFDFWAISRNQLIDAGLDKENIEIARVCTACNENYFSFRRDKTTGRLASVIALR